MASNSPIADYLKTYEENGELPNIEFDADEFLTFEYLKVGDMYL